VELVEDSCGVHGDMPFREILKKNISARLFYVSDDIRNTHFLKASHLARPAVMMT
jgi:hypothetical protein